VVVSSFGPEHRSPSRPGARLCRWRSGWGKPEHARRREGADAYRDQEMARLFETCDWSQERIGKKMGKRQAWVSQRLTFGRFLSFITRSDNPKPDASRLTEYVFRKLYRGTRGTENERFTDTARKLTDDMPLLCRLPAWGHDEARVALDTATFRLSELSAFLLLAAFALSSS